MASLVSIGDELRAFKANYPLLALGLFGTDEVPALSGELEVGIKNYGGVLQATLRMPATDEFAFVELPLVDSIWGFLESSLSDGTLRWQKPRPKGKRGS
jgi:hypothetical protein